MNLAGQILTLGGVALGAVTSFLVTSLNDRARWRREQSVRWDEQRLNTYGEYAHVVKEITHGYQRVAIAQGLTEGMAPLELTPEVSAELTAKEVHRAALAESLWLLGDSHTKLAAGRMNHCLWHLEWIVRGAVEADTETWKRAYTEFTQAREDFQRCARTGLGIQDSGFARSGAWPPAWHPASRTDQDD